MSKLRYHGAILMDIFVQFKVFANTLELCAFAMCKFPQNVYLTVGLFNGE